MRQFLKQHKKGIFWGIIAVSVLGLVSLVLYDHFHSNFDPNNHQLYEHFFLDSIGGVFTFLIGLFTIVGVYLALIQIREQKSIITNYPQLLENLLKFIGESKEEIKIVSFFILPGYWQEDDNDKRELLYHTFDQKKEKIEIITINKEEHFSILIDVAQKGVPAFKKESDVTPKVITDFQNKCELLLSNTKERYKLEYAKMPHYYFFVSRKRAIIVTPFGLPDLNNEIFRDVNSDYDKILGKTNPYIKNYLNNHKPIIKDKEKEAKVNTLGFETTDRKTIEILSEEFEKLKIISTKVEKS